MLMCTVEVKGGNNKEEKSLYSNNRILKLILCLLNPYNNAILVVYMVRHFYAQ